MNDLVKLVDLVDIAHNLLQRLEAVMQCKAPDVQHELLAAWRNEAAAWQDDYYTLRGDD